MRYVLPALFLMACGGSTSRATDILALTGDATAGEAVFSDNCAVCHAADGSGGTGPNLANESVGESAVNTVLNGKESMPSFGDSLSDQDVADLFAWLDQNVFN